MVLTSWNNTAQSHLLQEQINSTIFRNSLALSLLLKLDFIKCYSNTSISQREMEEITYPLCFMCGCLKIVVFKQLIVSSHFKMSILLVLLKVLVYLVLLFHYNGWTVLWSLQRGHLSLMQTFKKRLIKRYFMYICTRTFKLVKCSEQTFWAQCQQWRQTWEGFS